MDIDSLQQECIRILLDGNLVIDDKTGILSFDLREDQKTVFIEYAVNTILEKALEYLADDQIKPLSSE